jgi:hypothetical protein
VIGEGGARLCHGGPPSHRFCRIDQGPEPRKYWRPHRVRGWNSFQWSCNGSRGL